jgi:cytochrome P450
MAQYKHAYLYPEVHAELTVLAERDRITPSAVVAEALRYYSHCHPTPRTTTPELPRKGRPPRAAAAKEDTHP